MKSFWTSFVDVPSSRRNLDLIDDRNVLSALFSGLIPGRGGSLLKYNGRGVIILGLARRRNIFLIQQPDSIETDFEA